MGCAGPRELRRDPAPQAPPSAAVHALAAGLRHVGGAAGYLPVRRGHLRDDADRGHPGGAVVPRTTPQLVSGAAPRGAEAEGIDASRHGPAGDRWLVRAFLPAALFPLA